MLASKGAVVSDTVRPAVDAGSANETYQMLLNSVMSAGVSPEQYKKNQQNADATDPEDHSAGAIASRAMVLSHAGWLRFNGQRERLRYAWDEFFQDWDIMLCPPVATTAIEHDHRPFGQRTITVNGAPQPYFQQVFWSGVATAPLLPSTVFPTGLSRSGLPIGVQAIGNGFNDYLTIDFSRLMAEEIGGFQPPSHLDATENRNA
jgi:amidase